jgi:hypothetical protein
MKHYLFIYREDREAFYDPDYEWTDLPIGIEKEFTAGTTDEEIMEAARAHEIKDLIEDQQTAKAGRMNRVLMRVIQIAREIPIRTMKPRMTSDKLRALMPQLIELRDNYLQGKLTLDQAAEILTKEPHNIWSHAAARRFMLMFGPPPQDEGLESCTTQS